MGEMDRGLEMREGEMERWREGESIRSAKLRFIRLWSVNEL